MRKTFYVSFLALCVLTLLDADYTNIGWEDIAVFATMGIAITTAIAEYCIKRRLP